MTSSARILGLLKRKAMWVPTVRGWVFIFGTCIGVIFCLIVLVHPFLALNQPVDAELLVVEGWLPEYALQNAIYEFSKHRYRYMITTGGPISTSSYLSSILKYHNFAELAATMLLQHGFNKQKLLIVPAPRAKKNRTYASASALKRRLTASNLNVRSFNIITLGPHARRSLMLFKKAFGNSYTIGVISVEKVDYDPVRWWQSSQGVRTIINETIAFLYAKFLFHPDG